ncbi:MAG: hypothetical protein LKI42_02445 [Bacteroidales bacterium]|jgi:hypothetical protein|nr:hypothetical protein [Bacteroidales bacterium]
MTGNNENRQRSFKEKKLLIGLITVAAILLTKLFVIQIVDDKYKIDALNN